MSVYLSVFVNSNKSSTNSETAMLSTLEYQHIVVVESVVVVVVTPKNRNRGNLVLRDNHFIEKYQN